MAPARTAIEPLPVYGAVFANVEGQLPGTDLRDWRRAAAFLWITPLEAALPSRFWAKRTRSSASSAPWAMPSWATLIRVFSSERTPLFRTRRVSFWRLRFF